MYLGNEQKRDRAGRRFISTSPHFDSDIRRWCPDLLLVQVHPSYLHHGRQTPSGTPRAQKHPILPPRTFLNPCILPSSTPVLSEHRPPFAGRNQRLQTPRRTTPRKTRRIRPNPTSTAAIIISIIRDRKFIPSCFKGSECRGVEREDEGGEEDCLGCGEG